MKAIDRRAVVAGGVALFGMGVTGAAKAQAKPKLRLSLNPKLQNLDQGRSTNSSTIRCRFRLSARL